MELNLNYEKSLLLFKHTEIAVYEFGNLQSENIYFLFPSFPFSGLEFVAPFEYAGVTAETRFITFDIPGLQGESKFLTKSNSFLNLEELSDLAGAILRCKQVFKAHILGFSMGATLAAHFARKYQQNIKTITIVSPIIKPSLSPIYGALLPFARATKLTKLVLHYLKVKELEAINFYKTSTDISKLKTKSIEQWAGLKLGVFEDYLEILFKKDQTQAFRLLNSLNLPKQLVFGSDERRFFKLQINEILKQINFQSVVELPGEHTAFVMPKDIHEYKKVFEIFQN